MVRDTGIELDFMRFYDPVSDQRSKPLNWRHSTQYRVTYVDAITH